MTSLMMTVLHHAGKKNGLHGTAIAFEQQSGRTRQVNLLLKMKLIKRVGGRLLATRTGLKVLGLQPRWFYGLPRNA